MIFFFRGDEQRKKQIANAEAAEKKAAAAAASASKVVEWSVGSDCRAVYSEDGLEYEATIMSVEKKNNRTFCILKFFGYGAFVFQ